MILASRTKEAATPYTSPSLMATTRWLRFFASLVWMRTWSSALIRTAVHLCLVRSGTIRRTACRSCSSITATCFIGIRRETLACTTRPSTTQRRASLSWAHFVVNNWSRPKIKRVFAQLKSQSHSGTYLLLTHYQSVSVTLFIRMLYYTVIRKIKSRSPAQSRWVNASWNRVRKISPDVTQTSKFSQTMLHRMTRQMMLH